MKRLSIALVLFGAASSVATANCGPALLRIKGRANAQSANRQVMVTLSPDTKNSTPMVLVDGDRFEADVYYDPFKSYSKLFGYNCTKKPEKVTVALLDNGKEVDKVVLFAKDFVADRDGGYHLRTALRLGK